MNSIRQQIDIIFKHPSFTVAINKLNDGDESDLRLLIFELMFHVYEKSTLNARRTYGTNRWMEQTCKILEEIGNTAPPENLDLRLRIPPGNLWRLPRVRERTSQSDSVQMNKVTEELIDKKTA